MQSLKKYFKSQNIKSKQTPEYEESLKMQLKPKDQINSQINFQKLQKCKKVNQNIINSQGKPSKRSLSQEDIESLKIPKIKQTKYHFAGIIERSKSRKRFYKHEKMLSRPSLSMRSSMVITDINSSKFMTTMTIPTAKNKTNQTSNFPDIKRKTIPHDFKSTNEIMDSLDKHIISEIPSDYGYLKTHHPEELQNINKPEQMKSMQKTLKNQLKSDMSSITGTSTGRQLSQLKQTKFGVMDKKQQDELGDVLMSNRHIQKFYIENQYNKMSMNQKMGDDAKKNSNFRNKDSTVETLDYKDLLTEFIHYKKGNKSILDDFTQGKQNMINSINNKDGNQEDITDLLNKINFPSSNIDEILNTDYYNELQVPTNKDLFGD